LNAHAAVFRSALGYADGRYLREAGLFGPLAELPLVIEVLDRADKVQRLLPFLDVAMPEGIATLENVALGGD
jgi:PII-like signaling protein